MTVPSAVVTAVLSEVGGVLSTIWLECAWSAVTMTRVLPSASAKASAAWTASSKSIVSPIWPQAFAA